MSPNPEPAMAATARRRARIALIGAVLVITGVGGLNAIGQTAPVSPSIGPPQNVGANTPAVTGSIARPAAQHKRPATPVQSANGCGSPGALGVSRIQTIDTSTGPRYGHQQFKDIDFLNDGEIVLTFDDGPLRPYTLPVLKALDAHCTKATFFVVGRMALSDPSLVKDTAKRGHTIGTHTWSHMDLRKTNPARARGEMELGISAVSKALGQPVAPFFRFPFLSSPKSMLDYARSRNVGVFSIEVDSNDYRTKDPATVHHNVLSQLEDAKKGIILFHDIQPSTAGALKGLLDELKARGFKVVHLVASTPLATLPEFDAMAAREFSRKSDIAAADPLASRTIVWPVSGSKSAPAPIGDAQEEQLPWGKAVRHTVPITPPPRPKPATPPENEDFFTKLFKF